MKINYSAGLVDNQFTIDLTYKIVGKDKYVAVITQWNHTPEIMNIRTGLVIGFLTKQGFKRSWGFRKDLGRNGRVLKSAINLK